VVGDQAPSGTDLEVHRVSNRIVLLLTKDDTKTVSHEIGQTQALQKNGEKVWEDRTRWLGMSKSTEENHKKISGR
jgi:hypothetical protein